MIFALWSQRDPAGAAEAVMAMKAGNNRQSALGQVAKNWALQDPAGALGWAEAFTDTGTKNRLLRVVAQIWGEREPKAVIAWGSTLAEAGARQEIVTVALQQLAQLDVASAEEHLRNLPTSFERDGFIHSVAQMVASQDPKAALALAELLPAGPNRIATIAGVVLQFASTDPRAAAEIFLTFPAAQAVEHANVTGTMLARANLEVAQAWVDRLPAGPIKAEASRAVAEMMRRGDPRAAAAWFAEKSPGADLGWLLEGWAENAPQDVLAWAKELSDPDTRLSAHFARIISFLQASGARRTPGRCEELRL